MALEPPEPQALVIFGASGDLAKKKILPALYYLAVPPPAFPVIVDSLAKIKQNTPVSRIVIEKPFGHDLASAQELTAHVHTAFDESQIFRIDHYLGKETVQNISVFRFANSL